MADKISDSISFKNSVGDKSSELGDLYSVGKNLESRDISFPKGTDRGNLSTGNESIFNDYHIVCFRQGNYPVYESQEKEKGKKLRISKVSQLIDNPKGAVIYKPGDFIYSARHGMPVNRMITLRRFIYPVINDISNSENQPEPDVARMVTYMSNEINPISEVCKFSWKMNWKPLEAAFEDASSGIIGDESGISGLLKEVFSWTDRDLATNSLRGENQLNYDPTRDNNKVFGPVDSIKRTNIRDTGLETEMEFSIKFDYELKSINGVNQKYAFIDLLSNVLACTYNNGRFWGGTRFWVGKRPSTFAMKELRMLNPTSLEDLLSKSRSGLHSLVNKYAKEGGMNEALNTLKSIAKNALMAGLGKLLDNIGRPSLFVMNSLLRNEPTGEWHLTIGNPHNPIMSIGNLILTNTEFEFSNDIIGYDDMPTKFTVTCTLKPAMDVDRSGLESMFNLGEGRTYWKPSVVKYSNAPKKPDNSKEIKTSHSGYMGNYETDKINRNIDRVFDFVSETPTTLSKWVDNLAGTTSKTNNKSTERNDPRSPTINMIQKNAKANQLKEMQRNQYDIDAVPSIK